MGRKKAPISDMDVAAKLSAPLAKRLSALITDPNALKEYLGCSIQAISQYKLGISRPTLENLCKIADFYNVTTDFLLGRTPVKTTEVGLKSAARYTGLAESTLSFIHYNELTGLTETIDALFQNEDFQQALRYIAFLKEDCQKVPDVELSDSELDKISECEKWLEESCGAHIVHWALYREWQTHKILRFLEASIDTVLNTDFRDSGPSIQGGGKHG